MPANAAQQTSDNTPDLIPDESGSEKATGMDEAAQK